MSHFSRRRLASFTFALALLAGPAPHVFAQAVQVVPGTVVSPAQSAAATPPGIDPRQADELRDEFRELMRQYPPSLAQILRLDSALMLDSDYIAPYPALAAYLRAHPEITRHPDFFLNFANQNGWWSDPGSPDVQLRRDAINFQRSVMQNFTLVGAIAAVVLGILWLARLFISHRRWIRATRLQSELNNRLLERMGSSEQLVAYLQSQAGQHLMAVPAVIETTAPAMAAPFSRILWAVQAGIVLVSGGIGLLVIRRSIIEEAGPALLTLGVLAIAIGVGFGLASVASYLLSRRLGLFDAPHDEAASLRP